MWDDLHDTIKKYALSRYPEEACGVIIDNEFVPCDNVAPNKTETFAIDAEFTANNYDKIQCVFHSHPDGDLHPSEADMKSQIAMGKPYSLLVCNENIAGDLIFWGDSVRDERVKCVDDIVGRGFIHGIQDCYSVIRDWYYLQGIHLPEYPRKWNWWTEGDNLYDMFFADAGFYKLKHDEPRLAGDVPIMKVKSRVPNHAGILADTNTIIHHISSRYGYDMTSLSRRSGYGIWIRNIDYWVRYEK